MCFFTTRRSIRVGIGTCGTGLFSILGIRDVYPGSRIRNFSIPDPGSKRFRIPDPNQRILTQKITKLSKIRSGLFIQDPDPGSRFFNHPESRGQKGTGSRIRISKNCFFKSSLCLNFFAFSVRSLQLPHLNNKHESGS
jgi:hypothetical protein